MFAIGIKSTSIAIFGVAMIVSLTSCAQSKSTRSAPKDEQVNRTRATTEDATLFLRKGQAFAASAQDFALLELVVKHWLALDNPVEALVAAQIYLNLISHSGPKAVHCEPAIDIAAYYLRCEDLRQAINVANDFPADQRTIISMTAVHQVKKGLDFPVEKHLKSKFECELVWENCAIAAASGGNVTLAYVYMNRLSPRYSIRPMIAIASTQILKGDRESGLQLLQKARGQITKVAIFPETQLIIIDSLIDAYLIANDIDQAIATSTIFRNLISSYDVIRKVAARNATSIRNLEYIRELILESSDTIAAQNTLDYVDGLIAINFAKSGNRKEAFRIIENLQEENQAYVVNILLKDSRFIGDISFVLWAVELFGGKPKMKFQLLEKSLSYFRSSGDEENSRKVVAEARRIQRLQGDNLGDNYGALSALATLYAIDGQWKESDELLTLMQEDDRWHAACIREIARIRSAETSKDQTVKWLETFKSSLDLANGYIGAAESEIAKRRSLLQIEGERGH